MYKVQLLLTEYEKIELENISKEIGLSQSRIGIVVLYSLISFYKEKGSFIFVDLIVKENEVLAEEQRNKRLQIDVPKEIKIKIEKLSKELRLSQSQIGTMALKAFIENYNKTQLDMFTNILNPIYRVDNEKKNKEER